MKDADALGPELGTGGDPLRGESLLASIGVGDFVRREHRRITNADHETARRLPGIISSRLRDFFSGVAPVGHKAEKSPPFDYHGVVRDLARPIQPADLESMVGGHRDPSDALDIIIPLSRAVAYLSGAAPRRSRQTLFSAELLKPSDQDISRFRRLYTAVDNPLALFSRLRDGRLLSDEVQAVSSVYPMLYQVIQQAAAAVFGELLVRRPGHKLGYERERQLRVLLQSGPPDVGLTRSMQEQFAKERAQKQEAEARPTARPIAKSGSYATPAQRTE